MPIELGYDEVRALSKKLRERTGRDVPHTAILDDLAAVTGQPMDGMMHALKTERGKKKAKKVDPREAFESLPKDEATGLPNYEDAAPFLDEIVKKQTQTKGGFLRISVENADTVAKKVGTSDAEVLDSVGRAFKKIAEDANIELLVARLGKREFIIVILGVSLYDNVSGVVSALEYTLEHPEEDLQLPSDLTYICCAKPLDQEIKWCLEEAEEYIVDVREYLMPGKIFSWNDPEGEAWLDF